MNNNPPTPTPEALRERLLLWTNNGVHIKADCSDMRIWKTFAGDWAYPYGDQFSLKDIIALAIERGFKPTHRMPSTGNLVQLLEIHPGDNCKDRVKFRHESGQEVDVIRDAFDALYFRIELPAAWGIAPRLSAVEAKLIETGEWFCFSLKKNYEDPEKFERCVMFHENSAAWKTGREALALTSSSLVCGILCDG